MSSYVLNDWVGNKNVRSFGFTIKVSMVYMDGLAIFGVSEAKIGKIKP